MPAKYINNLIIYAGAYLPMLKTISRVLLGNILSLFPVLTVGAEEIKVAVAANFAPLMQALIPDFKAKYPSAEIILISGSSGKLYAQIVHGAPYDILLSADQEKPILLVNEGLAIADSRFTYARGQVVLWSRHPALIQSGETVLLNGNFNKLAIANSRLAPYGKAAEQVLSKLNLLQFTRNKWVQGENIAQTFQFVETGNADLGFVAKSQIWREGRLSHGSVWLIPDDWYLPINQDAVLLRRSQLKTHAVLLLDFLKQPQVRAKIASFGYQPLVDEASIERDNSD